MNYSKIKNFLANKFNETKNKKSCVKKAKYD